jgi:hypothetical protein
MEAAMQGTTEHATLAVGVPYRAGRRNPLIKLAGRRWWILLTAFCSLCVVGSAAAQTQLGADIDGEVSGDQSGFSVALSSDGSRVAIGGRVNDGTALNAGHVRVYQWSGAAWVQLGADIDGEASGDQSGFSVALSSDGNRVAIGAPFNGPTDDGHVRVYQWSGVAWVQVGADIDRESANDQFGISVALSSDGSRLAIGGNQNGGSGFQAGHVRVFDWSGAAWVQVGADINGEAPNDGSGTSVALSSDGSRVAIGASLNGPTDAGHVRIYQWSGVAWIQLGADIDGEADSDRSGTSVALSSDGSRVAIGAHNNSGFKGHVRVYDWSGAAWMQVGVDIDGEAFGDQSGIAVALSSDGSRVGIGAFQNAGTGAGAGHVRLYDWSGTAWVQLGADIDGEAAGNQSGRSVALSSYGGRVAIGSPSLAAGHVRVYEQTAVPVELSRFTVE